MTPLISLDLRCDEMDKIVFRSSREAEVVLILVRERPVLSPSLSFSQRID